jgi:hypothetical protein
MEVIGRDKRSEVSSSLPNAHILITVPPINVSSVSTMKITNVIYFIALAHYIHSSPVPDSTTAGGEVETITLPNETTTATLFSAITLGIGSNPSPTSSPQTQSSAPAPTASAQAAPRANPILTGYVAFGDSFAAGFGTGTTSGDSCRRGQFSYPNQIASTVSSSIDFQNLPCSGAKVTDVLSGGTDSQIDAWVNANLANIATLSIGGNDLGFSEVLDSCVIKVLDRFSGDCDKAISKANDIIQFGQLSGNITLALSQIINKSGRADFKIYVTGYTAFFNVDTDYCDQTTFWYWNPHHAGLFETLDPQVDPALTKDLRLRLNNLVTDLNRLLIGAIDNVNTGGTQHAVFVDPNTRFNGHRFCEQDNGQDVQEPAPNRQDTWFFLSAWPDNNLANSIVPFSGDELAQLAAGNTTAMPDPDTACGPINQGGGDMFDTIFCDVAQINANSSDPNYHFLVEDQQSLRSGNVTDLHIPWWMPTRQGKTFHPRTLGQEAYKLAIMDVW